MRGIYFVQFRTGDPVDVQFVGVGRVRRCAPLPTNPWRLLLLLLLFLHPTLDLLSGPPARGIAPEVTGSMLAQYNNI